LLALALAVDRRGNFRIGGGERSGKEPVFAFGNGRPE
jgi:hypothetical protein